MVLTVLALGLVVLAAAPWVDRVDPWWWPAVQSLGRLWILVALVGLLVGLLARAWLSCGIHLVVIAVVVVTIVNVGNRPACGDGTGPRLAVMSLNALHAQADVDQLAAAVERHDIDVLVIAEVSEPMIAALEQTSAGRRFGYRSGSVGDQTATSGTVVLSRHPATDLTVPDSRGTTFQQPGLTLDIDGTKVLVRGIHAKSPVKRWVDDWRTGLLDLGRWQREQRAVPIVLAGDFNASGAHAPFRDARRGLDDTAGRWPRATWPMLRAYPPFVSIDHILVRELSVVDSGTEDIAGTDHRAVWAGLRVCT